MDQPVTKREFESAIAGVNKNVNDVLDVLRDFMGHVDERFDGVEGRLDKVEHHLDKVEHRLDIVEERLGGVEKRAGTLESEFITLRRKVVNMDSRLNALVESQERLQATINAFVARLDDEYEAKLAERDNRFEKLLAWARKVSEKTGVPLEEF